MEAAKFGHDIGRATKRWLRCWILELRRRTSSKNMIIPQYPGIKLVELGDHLELVPVGWYRNIVGLGRFKADKVGLQPGESLFPMFKAAMGTEEIWVIVSWRIYEDGTEEVDDVIYCDPQTTLEDAQRKYHDLIDFLNLSREQLNEVARVIGESMPIIHSYSEQKTDETRELYQARLKALAGMQPKTIALIQQALEAKDDTQRKKLECEAVQAFFAEAATYWPDDVLMAWQRNNPVGSKWLCEFAKVIEEPERQLDPINHELAMNWLRRGYNLMTENELSDAILIATGQRVMPNTLKKKRGKQLGLTARRTGPRPNSEQ